MADVLHRTTRALLRSVSTPDYAPTWRKGEPSPTDGDWVVNPDLSAVNGVDPRYWKVVKNDVLPMDEAERVAVDSALADEAASREKARLLALDADVKKATVEAGKVAPVG